MREYSKIAPQFWIDADGTKVPVLKSKKLRFSKPGAAQLLRFVVNRDGGKCVICGASDDLVVDHIVSIRNGGSNHPTNLRLLCCSCNARKVGLFDARKVHEKRHLTNGSWVVSECSGGVSVGVILPGKSVSFTLDTQSALEISNAIIALLKNGEEHGAD